MKKRKGNKQYEYIYFDFREMGMTLDKIRNHFIYCQKIATMMQLL